MSDHPFHLTRSEIIALARLAEKHVPVAKFVFQQAALEEALYNSALSLQQLSEYCAEQEKKIKKLEQHVCILRGDCEHYQSVIKEYEQEEA